MSDMKKSFFAKYRGPVGKHLSCLTSTTMTGSYKDEHQKSIHPYGRGSKKHRGIRRDGEGYICAPKKRTKGPLAKRSKELDRRRRETDGIIAYVKANPIFVYSEGSYKTPGSMRG